jgi:hypothetical protein
LYCFILAAFLIRLAARLAVDDAPLASAAARSAGIDATNNKAMTQQVAGARIRVFMMLPLSTGSIRPDGRHSISRHIPVSPAT